MFELCVRNEIRKWFVEGVVLWEWWPVRLPQVGPVCASVRMLEGYVAIVVYLGICRFLFWVGIAGGSPKSPGFQSRLLE